MNRPASRRHPSPSRDALRIATIYAGVAAAWILASDWLLVLLASSAERVLIWETAKGLAFVAVTASLLFVLVRALLRRNQASERHFSTLVDNLPGGAIFRLQRDPGGDYRFTYASQGVEQIIGIGREQMLADAQATFALTEAPYDRTLREANEASARDLSVFDLEIPLRQPNGGRKWVAIRSMPQRLPDGTVIWDGVAIDINERKRAELETLEMHATLETALASMGDAVMISDADGNLIHLNEAFASFHRFERLADCPTRLDAYPGLLEISLPDGTPAPPSEWAIQRALRGETAINQEYRLQRKDTGESWIGSYNWNPIRADDGRIQGAVVTGRDVTHAKAAQAELDRIAHHDPLTGLPNRRLLSDRLEHAIALADRTDRSLAVCYLDLDGFKPINDRYGHHTGDQFLIEIAEVLRRSLRGHDSVARLGGDEFALVLTELQHPEDCDALLNRILEKINRPVSLDGIRHQLSASVGVTLYPADRADPDALLRHADQAMYRAKQSGKNGYQLYDAEQAQALQHRRLVHEELVQALERNALVLHYQPQIDMISREVIGVEALIRWPHPSKGLLPPAAFLPLIEDSPLEPPLSDWVIDTALAQLSEWNRRGLQLRVGINVSAGQLMFPGFATRLQEQLERHPEVRPDQVEIEVLESTAFDDFKHAQRVLTDCRKLGVRFALDDFGTGYSSLAYFRTLPVDILKIDQSFVRDMIDDPGDRAIVESVVKLSQAFNRSVIAEGVETLEHAALVTWLGCHFGQGYGIARPMPAADLPGWVADWTGQPGWPSPEEISDRPEIQLMVAAQHHLSWLDSVVRALDDQDSAQSVESSADECVFGRWYQGRAARAFGRFEAYRAIDPAHQRPHEIAGELLNLAAKGRHEEALARLGELSSASDSLIAKLSALLESVRENASFVTHSDP